MPKLREAVLFSVANQYLLQIISFVSVAVLARLLTPEQIGLFSVAVSISYLAVEIRSFGASEYLVREKEISPEIIRSVLGVMVIMCWGLGGLLLLLAPSIAEFYSQPDLRDILWIITIPFFWVPYISIPFSLLLREMRFERVLMIDFIGALVRNGVSIALVLLGYSYYGLAYGALAGVFAELVVVVCLCPSAMLWLPSFRKIAPVFKVGLKISLSKFLNSMSQNAPDLILGRMDGMRDVAFFSRGMGLIMFLHNALIQAVAPVALPHLSHVKRTGGNLPGEYVQAISLVGAFCLPLFAVVNLSAFPMIRALFGDQWDAAVAIASSLVWWQMLRSVHCFAPDALIAASKEHWMLYYEISMSVVKVIALITAIPSGLQAVAEAFVVVGIIKLLLTTLMMRVAIGVRISALVVAFVPNILLAALCWGVLKLALLQVDIVAMNPWLALLLIGSLMVPTWLIGLRLTKNSAWPIASGFLLHAFRVAMGRGARND